MNVRRTFVCLGLAAAVFAPLAKAAECNVWPFYVGQMDANGQTQSWQGAGPLLFEKKLEEGGTASGFRPVYLLRQDAAGVKRETDFLYPVFTYRTDGDTYRWSILNLINRSGPAAGAVPAAPANAERIEAFALWPFYFSRQTGDPATSYRALFPVGGTIKNRFGDDRIDFVLFPLYGRFQKRDHVEWDTPWPFVRTFRGGGHSGFALWPLFGWHNQAGVARAHYYLWPLIYKDETHLDEPVPSVSLGVLPFYALDRRPGSVGETYLWPFFGYTDRTAPYRYHETRWFWPLLVQARGDDRYINRWAPIYTHSVIKGDDKHWVLWPLWRQETWTEAGLVQEKTQFLYFVYWSLRQRSATNAALAPAEKTHFWPLFSVWDNGAGRRQLQFLNPLEVFFPRNEQVQLVYSPLFALYRYDRRAPGDVRHSFLWDAVTFERRDGAGTREFHLGPLLSVETRPAGGRIALGHGLFGLQRDPGDRGWHAFLFDFSRKPTNLPAAKSAP